MYKGCLSKLMIFNNNDRYHYNDDDASLVHIENKLSGIAIEGLS